MCVLDTLTVLGCVCACFAYICVSMERYRKGSEDNPHQSPTQHENGERDGGWIERWRSPQEAAFGEKERGETEEKWMNGWSSPGWL